MMGSTSNIENGGQDAEGRVKWSRFVGKFGGRNKVYSEVIDHAARVLFNTSCCFGRAGREAGELRRWAGLCVSIPSEVVYLALAETLPAPLITCDARLAAAPGHQAAVELFGADRSEVT